MVGTFRAGNAIGSRCVADSGPSPLGAGVGPRRWRHALRALHDEDDAPGPFEAVFVLAFGKAVFHVFPGFFVKIAWVGFFHR
jgi:hypothetical protein